jgi:hypothetical protein
VRERNTFEREKEREREIKRVCENTYTNEKRQQERKRLENENEGEINSLRECGREKWKKTKKYLREYLDKCKKRQPERRR